MTPKLEKVDILLIVFKMISNNSQPFGIIGEPLFIEDAYSSFSLFINSLSKISLGELQKVIQVEIGGHPPVPNSN
jgi:hypothetical protein